MRQVDRGDTIIEVVLAFAIFSLAAVGTMALLNAGVATTQRNLEITLVRQQVDAQAEILRYLRDTKNNRWQELISPANIVTNPLSLSESCRPLGGLTQAFYMKPTISANPGTTPTVYTRQTLNGTTYVSPTTYAKIDYTAGALKSEGIWIQAAKAQTNNNAGVNAYDFYIHACWNSVGVNEPMTAGTIVRIYD